MKKEDKWIEVLKNRLLDYTEQDKKRYANEIVNDTSKKSYAESVIENHPSYKNLVKQNITIKWIKDPKNEKEFTELIKSNKPSRWETFKKWGKDLLLPSAAIGGSVGIIATLGGVINNVSLMTLVEKVGLDASITGFQSGMINVFGPVAVGMVVTPIVVGLVTDGWNKARDSLIERNLFELREKLEDVSITSHNAKRSQAKVNEEKVKEIQKDTLAEQSILSKALGNIQENSTQRLATSGQTLNLNKAL